MPVARARMGKIGVQRHQADELPIAAGVKEPAPVDVGHEGAACAAGVELDGPGAFQSLKRPLHRSRSHAIFLRVLLYGPDAVLALHMHNKKLPRDAHADELLFIDRLYRDQLLLVQSTVFCILRIIA